MGGDRTKTSSQSSTQYTPTPEETRLNQLDIQLREGTQAGLMQSQNSGLSLINQLLTGGSLPGFLSNLPGGIDEATTQDISRNAISDIQPYFAQSGLLDSGVNASVSGRVAGDVRRQSAEFNIGNKLNLLNLALSGQAQVQSPILGNSANLGSRLAGLRSSNTTGMSTVTAMNPFLKSFQQSAGQTLGSPKFGVGSFSFGG